MTLLDIIEMYNLNNGKPLYDISAIFDDIVLDSRLDKEVLAGVLVDECGALNSVYNVTATFKYFSDLFFKKYQWNITKLVNTLEAEYDPLKNRRLHWTTTSDIDQNLATVEDIGENRTKDNTGTQTNKFDGTVENEYTENVEGENSETSSGNIVKTNSNRTDTTNTETVGKVRTEDIDRTNSETRNTDFDSTETNTISAMNSDSYQPDTQRVTDSTTQETVSGSGTEDVSENETTTTNGSGSETKQGREEETKTGSGNGTNTKDTTGTDNTVTDNTNVRTDRLTETISATTDRDKNEQLAWDQMDEHVEDGTVDTDYQTLIEKERKVAQFSIYGWIAKRYAKELFLLVY